MQVERLIYMANQIGSYFVSQRGKDADRRIADHLKRFWDPRMRNAIVAHVRQGGSGLDPAVKQAVLLLEK